MSTLRRRLEDLEEHKAFQRFLESERLFNDRSDEELRFFGVYGYFPESVGEKLPDIKEFTVTGMRITVTAERIGRS